MTKLLLYLIIILLSIFSSDQKLLRFHLRINANNMLIKSDDNISLFDATFDASLTFSKLVVYYLENINQEIVTGSHVALKKQIHTI